MSNYKGSGVVFVRSLLQKKGAEVEKRFLEALTERERDSFLKTTATSWVPIEEITRYFEVAAPLLYPGQLTGLREIGRAMAADHLTGVYRFVARVTTVPFLMAQSAKLWGTYHRVGKAAWQAGDGPKHTRFVVEDYPALPDRFRECLCGYIIGLLELAGVHDIKVVKPNNTNPNCWTWSIYWK